MNEKQQCEKLDDIAYDAGQIKHVAKLLYHNVKERRNPLDRDEVRNILARSRSITQQLEALLD